MPNSYLQGLVIDRCRALGFTEAASFFGVSEGLIRQWTAGSKTPSLAAVELVFQTPDAPVVPGHEAQWAGKEVFLALPFYKSVDPRTLFSIMGIWDRAKFGASVRYGDAYVSHTRNNLAHDFLSTGLPEILWLDDDMIVPRGDAGWFNFHTGFEFPAEFAGLHTPTQLRSHGKTIVGGTYFGRGSRARAVYYEAMLSSAAGIAEDKLAHSGPAHRLRQVWWTGTGCLWHKREVLLDIQKAFPNLAPETDKEPWHFFSNRDDLLAGAFPEIKAKVNEAAAQLRGQNGAAAEAILLDAVKQIDNTAEASKIHSALQQGEDQTFGKRAKIAGHQSHVDHAIVCGHVGSCVYGPKNTGIY
jgi:hypothetical protein